MNVLELLSQSLLSPPILFFLCGLLMGVMNIDFQLPESISKFLSIYLIIAIGLKGGFSLAVTGTMPYQMIVLLATGVMLSFLLPFLAYFLLKKTTKLDRATAAALAAHYGSVSIVTFVTAGSFLRSKGLVYPEYIIAILAAMEAPAIFSGMMLATGRSEHGAQQSLGLANLMRNNGCLFLLFAAFFIGIFSGPVGFEKLRGFFESPFQGALCLFLLDMGLLVMQQLVCLKSFTWQLLAFGCYMPLLGAGAGLLASMLVGADQATGMMFMVLCSSASYIAVPAAMRLAVPEAKPSIYLPMALAVTFPFNVIVGIPLYYMMAAAVLQ